MKESDKINYIEFTGIAGIGKSTITNELVKLFEKHEIPYGSRYSLNKKRKGKLKKFFYGLLFLLIHPFYTLKGLRLFLRLKPNNPKDFFRFFSLLSVRMAYFREKYKNNVIIFDQGFFKILPHWITNTNIETKRIRDLFVFLLRDTHLLLVYIDTKDEYILKRRLKDLSTKTRSIDPEKNKKSFSRFRKGYKKLFESVEDIPNVLILKIDGNLDARTNALTIFNYFNGL